MKSESVVKDKDMLLVGITHEFDTSEECALSNIFKLKRNNALKGKSLNYKFENIEIPVFIFGDEHYIKSINEEIINNKNSIYFNFLKNNIDKIKNIGDLKDFEFFYMNQLKNPIIDDFKILKNRESYYVINGNMYNPIYINESIFIIIPNLNFMVLYDEEVVKKKYTIRLKKSVINKKEKLAELKKRKEDILKYQFNIIRNLSNKDRYAVLSSREFLSASVLIGYMNKEQMDALDKEIVPFTIKDKGIIEYKNKQAIDKEYYELKKYRKEEEKERKKFEKVKEKLKKKGFDWFSLESMHKDKKGIWRMWLNPVNQRNYNFGWFTLQDYIDLLNDKGCIIINKEK